MNSNNNKAILDFVGMTGVSKREAKKYLSENKWNFQNALNMYFDHESSPQFTEIDINPQIQNFFLRFARQKSNKMVVDDEGLSQLFRILRIDFQNPVIGHIMINVMEMQKVEELQKLHLYNLLKYTRTSSFSQLTLKIPQLQNQLMIRTDLFQNMYDNLFALYSSTQSTTIDFEIAEQLWIVYLRRIMPFHSQFVEYLENMQNKPAKVHKDLWRMMYQFSFAISSLEDYREEEGWPIFLDEFVEFLRKRQ